MDKPMMWEDLMPKVRGNLPNGGHWTRTDSSRSEPTPIAVMGAFPTHLVGKIFLYNDPHKGVLRLATKCEGTSFQEGSKSGRDFGRFFLDALPGLSRDQICFFDMYPYYLASEDMYQNFQIYAARQGMQIDVLRKPTPQGLIDLANSTPGNLDRIREILTNCQPSLLLTLSAEVVAFVRRIPYSEVDPDKLFYREPQKLDILGYETRVVHLAHPNSVSRIPKWQKRHNRWCNDTGSRIVAQVIGGAQ
jgi:hypothetical protein